MKFSHLLLTVLLAGCAARQDSDQASARWIGEFPGRLEAFAACIESSTPQTMSVRTVHYDEAGRADVIVSPPPTYAIADYEVSVTQAQTDKVRVIFQGRTAMDYGQTEQHVRHLAGVCGKTN